MGQRKCWLSAAGTDDLVVQEVAECEGWSIAYREGRFGNNCLHCRGDRFGANSSI